MRFLPFILLAVIAFFPSACERQPVGKDPDPRFHKEHSSAKHESGAAEKKHEPATPTEGPKSGDTPKFFPEKK